MYHTLYVCVCVYTCTHTSLEADFGSHMDHFPWNCVQNKTVEATVAPNIIKL